MKAMILAAGRGERLRPLTDHTPKPLIEVGGQPLIGHHLSALAAAGIDDIVVNIAYRGDAIVDALGAGAAWGAHIRYSHETPGALDTGGGVRQALALLGAEPFVLVSADVFTDYDFRRLPAPRPGGLQAVMVANPPHNSAGDFGLASGDLVDRAPRLTYAGIGVFDPVLFRDQPATRFALGAILRAAVSRGVAGGQYHAGRWLDVGRPSALQAAREYVGAH